MNDRNLEGLRRAEYAVVGAALAGEFEELRAQGITSKHFNFSAPRRVFAVVESLAAEGRAADTIAVSDALAGEVLGGPPAEEALLEMSDLYTTKALLPAFVEEVITGFRRREEAREAQELINAIEGGNAGEIAAARRRLADAVGVEIEEPDGEEDGEGGGEEPVEGVPLPDGIVGETARWIAERCEKPFMPFAMLSSLAVWATLAGRKVRYQNQGTILYGMLVAASSNGKDAPLALARSILSQMGVSSLHFSGRLSSWNAGVEKLMGVWFHPASLAIVDEAAGYFGGGVGGADFGLMDFLKAVWSRSQGTLDPQGRTKKAGAATLSSVHRPSLSQLLAAQPSTLGEAVKSSQLEDGLLPRALWVTRREFVEEVVEENLERSRKLEDSEEGGRILRRGRDVWNWLQGQDRVFLDMADLEGRQDPKAKAEDGEEAGGMRMEVWQEPIAFGAEEKAVEIFRDFTRRTQARIRPAAEGAAGPFGYLWGKATENAKRVALILAAARCGATCGPFGILEEEAAWAVRFVEATVYAGIRWAKENMADTPFQKKVNRVLGFIRAAPGGVAMKRKLLRGLHLSSKELGEVTDTLIQSDEIEAVQVRTPGRSAHGYRLRVTKG